MTAKGDHDRCGYEGPERRTRDKQWHLDRRVPIAFILTLLVQSAVIVWWARGIDSDVINLKNNDGINKQLPERIAKLEGSITQLNETLRDWREELRRRR